MKSVFRKSIILCVILLYFGCSHQSPKIDPDDLFSLYKVENMTINPKEVTIQWEGESVTLQCQNRPLEPIVKTILKHVGKSFSMKGRLYGTVSLAVKNENYLSILKRILSMNGYLLDDKSAVWKIDRVMTDGNTTRQLVLFDLDAQSLCQKLKDSYDSDIKITLVAEHNALILSGDAKEVEQLEITIGMLDHPAPSILLEIVLLEINKTKFEDYGISINELGNKRFYLGGFNSSGDFTGQTINGLQLKATDADDLLSSLVFKANIRALQRQGMAKILTHPHVVSRSGEQAVVEISLDNYLYVQKQSSEDRTIFFDVEKVSAGVTLKMVPVITQSGSILINLHAEESIVLPPDKNANFLVDRNTLQSTLRAKDGEVIVAGGLIQKSEISGASGVPILRQIPIINLLFNSTTKERSKQEVVFFILPKIFHHKYQGLPAKKGEREE